MGFRSVIVKNTVPAMARRLSPEFRRVIAQSTNRTAAAVHETAVESVSGSGSGTLYRRVLNEDGTVSVFAEDGMNERLVVVYKASGGLNKSETHRASFPGSPPAKDTGALASGIILDLATASDLVAEVRSTAEYSEWLEFGTKGMEARPFLIPAMNEHREGAVHGMRVEIRKNFQGRR